MGDWKDRLRNTFDQTAAKKQSDADKIAHAATEVKDFYRTKVEPAFLELRGEIEKYGRQADVRPMTGGGREYVQGINVTRNGNLELYYVVRVQVSPDRLYVAPVKTQIDWTNDRRFTSEGYFKSNDPSDITKDEIISNFLDEYAPIVERATKGR